MKSVFRSYYDSYYNNLYNTSAYPGIYQAQKSIASFLDRCSHFISNYLGHTADIKDYWLDETKKRYKENTSLWVRLEPEEPRVGSTLTYSVFNNPSTATATIHLQRGSGLHPDFTEHTVTVPEKISFNNAVGYTVTSDDVGASFRLLLSGMPFSDWTEPVQA